MKTRLQAQIATLRGRLAEFEQAINESDLAGAISSDEAREIHEAMHDLNRDLLSVLPTPYCEACRSYHCTPYTSEHHAALGCRAVFKATP